jgi:hypothetical protein
MHADARLGLLKADPPFAVLGWDEDIICILIGYVKVILERWPCNGAAFGLE